MVNIALVIKQSSQVFRSFQMRQHLLKPCLRLIKSVMFSRVSHCREYNRVLQSVKEYYRVLQSMTECYRVLQSITEYCRVLQGISSASTWTNFLGFLDNRSSRTIDQKILMTLRRPLQRQCFPFRILDIHWCGDQGRHFLILKIDTNVPHIVFGNQNLCWQFQDLLWQ